VGTFDLDTFVGSAVVVALDQLVVVVVKADIGLDKVDTAVVVAFDLLDYFVDMMSNRLDLVVGQALYVVVVVEDSSLELVVVAVVVVVIQLVVVCVAAE